MSIAIEYIEMEPQMNADERRLNALSDYIVGAAFEVGKSVRQLLYKVDVVFKV